MLCKELGMCLTDCLRKTTYRQYLVWMVHLKEEWNRPGREDHYLMGIACEVRRVLSKNPNSIQPQQFKIKFKDIQPPKVLTPEEQLEKEKRDILEAKARWCIGVGLPVPTE